MQRKNKGKALEKKIRVGAVSYLNTKPLLWGLENTEISDKITLVLDYPSRLAQMLKHFEIDLGLVPVAILPELPDYQIVSDFCIGAKGRVGSVSIFSKVPLLQIKTVLLDYQSRTSVALAQILFKHYWHHHPVFVHADSGYESSITGNTAALIIGDRAFLEKEKGFYEFDLAETWKKMTGLPFVFAVWAANTQLPEGFIDEFNQCNRAGLQKINQIAKNLAYNHYNLLDYYTNNISYSLTEEKRKGLNLFLKYLRQQPLCEPAKVSEL